MTHDGMPRAYLRIDPNLDMTHSDVEGMVRLLCAAARQPERGSFRDRSLLERLLGRARVRRMYDRGDVVDLPDGRVYVEGWDEWQEGDHTVAERMRRMRQRRTDKRHSTVTPVTVPSSPPRIDVTTDAVAKDVGGTPEGDDNRSFPPPPAERGRRKDRTNPRATGTAPRQNGHAPRDLGESPRQRRQAEKTGPTRLGAILEQVRAAEGSS